VVGQLERAGASVAFASRADLDKIATRGPLTPDHVIRTKPLPLVAEGGWPAAVADYAQRYRAYFERNATPGLTMLDPAPRWVIWRGAGFVTLETSVLDAAAVADLARHTARAIEQAEQLGGWCALAEPDLFQVEYLELEQAKL